MTPAVAVLGAGIMGSATALQLASRGVSTILFDRERVPFAGASRWNEGKVHLGFLYSADPSLRTARAVLTGGLAFRDEVERLTGTSLAPATTPADDLYLLHRDSVTAPDAARRYLEAVAELVRGHAQADRYLCDVTGAQVDALDAPELEALADPAVVVAGYRVPERSVDTNFVADAFVEALGAEPRVELALGQTVTRVTPAHGGGARWYVHTAGERHGPFATVVNALWEGRPSVDRSVGHRPDVAEQHRYRVSVFAETAHALEVPSAVVAAGPFGDVKNYDGRHFYLSWYETGLLAREEGIDPPLVPELLDSRRQDIAAEVFRRLSALLHWVPDIERATTARRVEGGWVYSQGRGRLDQPGAGVHRRDRLGISRVGSYFSVDTGKYSVAPHLARELTETIVASS